MIIACLGARATPGARHRTELARELGLEATIADGTLRSVVIRRKK